MASGSDTNTVGREGSSISICSWNVNGHKRVFGRPAFEEYVKKHDIVFLSETMLMEDPPDIHDFEHLDQKAIQTGGRPSGGMVVYYRSTITVGEVDKETRNVMWFEFTSNDKCIVICFIYLPAQVDDKVYLRLQPKIKKYKEEGKDVYITGDFNARVGGHHEANEFFDKGKKGGKKLLDFCNKLNMKIINGHHPKDTPAKFTYCTVNVSTIDYLITSEDLKEKLADFYVDDVNNFSDHLPLVFKIKDANSTNAQPQTPGSSGTNPTGTGGPSDSTNRDETGQGQPLNLQARKAALDLMYSSTEPLADDDDGEDSFEEEDDEEYRYEEEDDGKDVHKEDDDGKDVHKEEDDGKDVVGEKGKGEPDKGKASDREADEVTTEELTQKVELLHLQPGLPGQ